MARGPQHQQIVVSSKEQFDLTVQRYIALGYGPRQMTSDLAILVRMGEPKALGCAFFFWLIVFFPIAIMMYISNQRQAQEMTVTVRLDPTGGGSVLPGPRDFQSAMPQELVMSPDRDSWWDGAKWVNSDQHTPPMAKRNADGTLWWDGEEWRAVR